MKNNLGKIDISSVLPEELKVFLMKTGEIKNNNETYKFQQIEDLIIETDFIDLGDVNLYISYDNKKIWGDCIVGGKSIYEYKQDQNLALEEMKYDDLTEEDRLACFSKKEVMNFYNVIEKKNIYNKIILNKKGTSVNIVYLPDYKVYGLEIGFHHMEILFDNITMEDVCKIEDFGSFGNLCLFSEELGDHNNMDKTLKLIYNKNSNFKKTKLNGKEISLVEYYSDSHTVSVDEEGHFCIKDYFGNKIKTIKDTYKNLKLTILTKDNILGNPYLEGYIVIHNLENNEIVGNRPLVSMFEKTNYYAFNFFEEL